jgi:serine/threonine protein kinase
MASTHSENPLEIHLEQTDVPLPKHWKSGSLKYQDFQPLAEGGAASIQTCLDNNLHRVVAYKSLHPHLLNSDLEVARFTREARVTAMISHPGTVPVYEVGRDRTGALYFTMKKLEGRDLRSILLGVAAKNPQTLAEFPTSRLIDILIQACQTVSFAHAQGVIHRDLKPANLLIGGFGEVMVLDWGLAKVRGEHDLEDVKHILGEKSIALELTQPGQRYGTPLYMSPEQASGVVDVDERADVYNLGSILYEMLTHKNLVWGSSVEEVLNQIRHCPTPKLREIAPARHIARELEAICLRALQKQPEDRYASVAAFAEDLQSYRDGLPVSVCDDPLTHAWRWMGRHGMIVVAAAAAAAGASVMWLLMRP